MLVGGLHNLTLPIEDPVLKFFLVLVIILGAPLLLNKIKVPHLLGLIVAGAIVGPNGFGLLSRDSSIVVTGTTGLLYIMFLAGLEIDLGEFKKNKWKSLGYGAITFIYPFVLGFAGAYFLLDLNILTSVLFASLFSSQTLITYPMVSKMGIAKNSAVNITVGGTMITDVATLLVLAAVVGMVQGDVSAGFWAKLSGSVIVFSLVVLLGFPIIGRWFFKRVTDKISQYIFVLVMIYLASVLAEIAGIEAIIGAFFAGLALNKLIPHSSTLMNRVDFVGNAIFIPFFLISVGMLIDFSIFYQSSETLIVAAIMVVSSIGGKYLASITSQKIFGWTRNEGQLVFGLSTASAAATLATVMVGYNIILSENEIGEPVRLLNEHVLNGSILLILISCTIASFVTQSSGQKIMNEDQENAISGESTEAENILLAISHEELTQKMVNLSLLIKDHHNQDGIFALNVINEDKNESSVKNAEKIMNIATDITSAADVKLTPIKRYDNDVITGISNVIKEKEITDLVIGIDTAKGFSPSTVYNVYNGYLHNNHINVLLYHAAQPVATVKKYTVMIPDQAHREAGFFHALVKIWNLGRNSGSLMRFYAPEKIVKVLEAIHKKANIEAEFIIMESWNDAENTAKKIGEDEGLIMLMAKRGMVSYFPRMRYIPDLVNQFMGNRNYLLIYPFSVTASENGLSRTYRSYSDFSEISNIIKKIFKW